MCFGLRGVAGRYRLTDSVPLCSADAGVCMKWSSGLQLCEAAGAVQLHSWLSWFKLRFIAEHSSPELARSLISQRSVELHL